MLQRGKKVRSGELEGSITAVALPDIPFLRCTLVASPGNSTHFVYIGGDGVTVPDGTADTTSGIRLAAGESFEINAPMDSLSAVSYICSNADADLSYFAVQ